MEDTAGDAALRRVRCPRDMAAVTKPDCDREVGLQTGIGPDDRRLRLGSSLGDGSGLGARKCPEGGRSLVRSWCLRLG